jgi:hypothetical protein
MFARHTVATDRIIWKSDLRTEFGGVAPRILHYITLRYAQCITPQPLYLRRGRQSAVPCVVGWVP